MRVILCIFALAGLTNAARRSPVEPMDGADVVHKDDQLEQRRTIARGSFTPGVDTRSQARRAGP